MPMTGISPRTLASGKARLNKQQAMKLRRSDAR